MQLEIKAARGFSDFDARRNHFSTASSAAVVVFIENSREIENCYNAECAYLS
jgi:hypothetical protein